MRNCCDVHCEVDNRHSFGWDVEVSDNIPNLIGDSDKHYIHKQDESADVWTINHGLNKCPAVSVVDSAGTVVYGEVNYIDPNNLEIRFSAAFAGKAYLN